MQLTDQIAEYSKRKDFSKFRDAREHIDDPQFPVRKKISIVYGLHLKNSVFGTYKKFYQSMLPVIQTINENEKRPARILEIASGLGFLTLGLWNEVKNNNQVELTGSDIVPEYVLQAQLMAKQMSSPVQFKVIDALDHHDLEKHVPYDLIVNLHSLHHFTPDQLATLFRVSSQAATRGFYAIDGDPGLWNRLFMLVSALLPSLFKLDFCFYHDAKISAHKMYSADFLKGCAQLVIDENQFEIQAGKRSLGLNYISIMRKQ